MEKNLNLWQKLKIKYHYHWMDQDFHLYEPPALPTWYMTHTQKQINRRHAAYQAKVEKERREREETILELTQFLEELQEKEAQKNFHSATL